MTETNVAPPTPTLEQRVAALEQTCGQLNLTISVMHRALLRCQTRTWCHADPPKGWKAIWQGIKDLVGRKKRAAEVSELVRVMPNKSVHLDPVVDEQQDK